MKGDFHREQFEKCLQTTWLGRPFLYEKKLVSTNSTLKQRNDLDGHGLLLLAEDQTGGRGQYNRRWVSDPGKNLTFSVQLCPDSAHADGLLMLSLCMASSIVHALKSYVPGPIRIKWPNDVLIEGKKVAGILTEGVFQGNRLQKLILGVGLNVFQFPEGDDMGSVEKQATSVAHESGCSLTREQVLADILNAFEFKYTDWEQQKEYLCRSVSHELDGFGEWVQLFVDGDLQPGRRKFLGVNCRGECLLLNEDLNVDTFKHEQIRILTD